MNNNEKDLEKNIVTNSVENEAMNQEKTN